jgi:hypothetical protein
VNEDKLLDAVMTAVKLLSEGKRQWLIGRLRQLYEPTLEEEFAPMSPPKFSTWIM